MTNEQILIGDSPDRLAAAYPAAELRGMDDRPPVERRGVPFGALATR
jgi:hypothetical protein